MQQFTPRRASQVQARRQAANERLNTITAVVIAIVAAAALIIISINYNMPLFNECGVNINC